MAEDESTFRRLGLVRPEDFLLHLPLRYEDETRLVPIALSSAEVAGYYGDSSFFPVFGGKL